MIDHSCRAARAVCFALIFFTGFIPVTIVQAAIDLKDAVVVVPPTSSGVEAKASEVLIEEIYRRSHVKLARVHQWPANGRAIGVGVAAKLGAFAGPHASALAAETVPRGAEGFRIRTQTEGAAVIVVGNDPRGVLFGVGKLLRSLEMEVGRLELAEPLNIATMPLKPLRGHQLGYRPKPSSYDAWNVGTWDRYIRDLAIFGTNAIELIPPGGGDVLFSPHYPLPPLDMMVEMSRITSSYGLDVWIWYPVARRDYRQAEHLAKSLADWEQVLSKLPRVDHIFVPGGDPGGNHPDILMPLLEKQSANVRKFHPNAKIWVSPQDFHQEEEDAFYGYLERNQPDWFGGVVFGPRVLKSIEHTRRRTPVRYPVRDYPDITHTRSAQYPVPDWDLVYLMTLGREPINPRPIDSAKIFNATHSHSVGFISYSEGCNDDVNKMVWSALGWDDKTDLAMTLREFGRYFIHPRFADAFGQGLFALEHNFRGPVLGNERIIETLAAFRAMEKAATPQMKANWRFQQGLYRAYYDAYQRTRLVHERAVEQEAIEILRQARELGALRVLAESEAKLEESVTRRPGGAIRQRIFELAEGLYNSIRMQLSVNKYDTIGISRGGSLDTIDVPLNNRGWLLMEFERIRRLGADDARLKAIDDLVNWTSPGPGGYYDDLGNLALQPRWVPTRPYEEDPGFLESAHVTISGAATNKTFVSPPQGPRQLWDQVTAAQNAPVVLRYTQLDPHAGYRLKASIGAAVRVTADGAELVAREGAGGLRQEFDVPAELTRDGKLEVQFHAGAPRRRGASTAAGGEQRAADPRDPGGAGEGRSGSSVGDAMLVRR